VGLIEGAMKTSEAGVSRATSSSICESAILKPALWAVAVMQIFPEFRGRRDAFLAIHATLARASLPLFMN
jgi:hypothetical protein